MTGKKTDHTEPVEATPVVPQPENNTLGLTSMILGIISLTGPGLLLGIPAIVLGAMALKRKQGERGLSITGIVTGIVSTVVSLLVFLFAVFIIIIWSFGHPEQRHPQQMPQGGAMVERI